jgi:hypothetical protein
MYVCCIKNKVHTPLQIKKKKKIFGQTTWAREAGRHQEGDQRPN